MLRIYLILLLFILSACQTLPITQKMTAQTSQNSDLSLNQSQESNEIVSADFMVQRFNNRLQRFGLSQRVSQQAKKWYTQTRSSLFHWQRSPELVLQDILLAESQESILGAEASAEIQPDFQGRFETLVLKGIFKNRGRAIPLEQFLYAFESDLIQQTFIGKEPQARVLLDHSILLQIQSADQNEIVARLDTTAVPDFYLKGLHRISVEFGNYYTDALVKIGDPVDVSNLNPEIESAEIVFEHSEKPRFIRLQGKNFMLYPKFSYALIDGQFAFGFQTNILSDGRSETLIQIPEPRNFDSTINHDIIYTTPFGIAFTSVEGAQ